MRVIIGNKQNIKDIKEDTGLFGSDFKVYVIYALQEVNGKKVECISVYVGAEELIRTEIELIMYREQDEEDFQQMLQDYKDGLKFLENIKHQLMTLSELLEKLEKQNKII
ncbi:MAG TPA: hypothetical protein VGC17_01255 [Lactovum miscens]|uniref:hypothetical protein n=1 Tax=Lactovum miscens TaxID=190387 RepID=UPI002ED7986E